MSVVGVLRTTMETLHSVLHKVNRKTCDSSIRGPSVQVSRSRKGLSQGFPEMPRLQEATIGRTAAKLKLQYSGPLMQRANSLEKTLMLERIKTKGERDRRG